MNKAKLILSGIALFAVVGGAMAFKANKASLRLFYKITTVTNGACVTVSSLTTIGSNPTLTTPTFASGWYTTPDCTGDTFLAHTTVE
jgi:hypothetical protein